MNLHFSKRETLILVLTLLLTIASIFALYYLYLEPKYKNIDTQTASLKTEKELLASLQKQQQTKSDITAESLAVLQRKVPVKPQQEQLILDLEQAEVISGTKIMSMAFSEGDVAPAPAETQNNTNKDQANANDEEKNSNTDDKTDQSADNQAADDKTTDDNKNTEEDNNTEKDGEKANTYEPTPLPGGIKRLMVTLSVESNNYEELKKFMESLESLQRTIVIETISFSGTTEVTKVEATKDEKLSYNLTLSAFFMPGLTDLQDKLPELVAPPPANKTNPFNRFPDLNSY
ncbi:hypothetical protein HHO41_09590 [Bacillus sp. DNRA2]|uniref:hypothetical protein n=1 Tax=Bacillus sp. DNRA2 TaxID=2723053 RepID=UPI00145EA413|nr:hypothetical protein [Bacillus sp. DNRA2]NMD70544.1 hypothetical protein [Bacillus sp. DNRA2]